MEKDLDKLVAKLKIATIEVLYNNLDKVEAQYKNKEISWSKFETSKMIILNKIEQILND